MTLEAVDCQSFAGAFTLGAVQAGFELVGKREEVGGFGVTNCENNRAILGDRWKAEASLPNDWTPVDVPYVFGNPPCTGFSVLNAGKVQADGPTSRHRGIDSAINECMWHFVHYAARCRPEVIAFESVQGAYKIGRPLMQALRTRLEEMTGEQYTLYHVLHDAYEVGGVAIRPRYFWVAAKIPFGVDYPALTYFPLIEDAWRDLDGMRMTWEPQPYRRPATSAWTRLARNGQVATDGHIGRNNMNAQRIDDLMTAMIPFGGWPPRMSMYKVMQFLHENGGAIPDSCADTVKKYADNGWNTGFTCPLRWAPEEPARVVVGGALELAVHPWANRLITHREAARVMGFPDDWLIKPSRNYSKLGAGWGKGVTVDCGRWISSWARAAIEGTPGEVVGELIGDREYLIKNPNGIKTTRGYVKLQSGTTARQVVSVPTNSRLDDSTTSASSLAGVWYGGPIIPTQSGYHPPNEEKHVAKRGSTATDPSTTATDPNAVDGAPAEAVSRAGRPRPQLTLERDKAVALKMSEFELGQEWTKEEVADATGLPANVVYHCLNRLTWSGNVEKVGRGKFIRTDTEYSSDYVNKPERSAGAKVDTNA